MPQGIILAFGWMLLFEPGISAPPSSATVFEDFDKLAVGNLPKEGWQMRGGDAKGIYRIAEENGNRYLAAADHGKSVQLFRKGGWSLTKTPRLRWNWRVHQFPQGADERDKDKNDSAAALYVVFPRKWFVPEVIKYVWSAQAPEGTMIVRSSHFPLLVIRSGVVNPLKWVEEDRNVAEDFRKLFKRKASDPVAIGFLTDANAVKGTASADYDNVRLSQ